jgi:sterol desaturase/sphingolipid hydroxylase (fatty acid hydroxylase superfamily)
MTSELHLSTPAVLVILPRFPTIEYWRLFISTGCCRVSYQCALLYLPSYELRTNMPTINYLSDISPLHWSLTTWIVAATAFYTILPALLNLWFRRGYPQHLLQPAARAQSTYPSRDGRWGAFVVTYIVNTAVIGTCLWIGCQLQLSGIGNLKSGTYSVVDALLLVPQMLIVLLVFDAQFYWIHRAAHRHAVLFRLFHRDHHADRYPDAWSSAYQHPLDLFISTGLPLMWAVLLPVHEVAWWIAILTVHGISLAGHSGVEITHRAPGLLAPNGVATALDAERTGIAGWFNTVTHHDLHHQRFNVNFGLFFTVWDRLMGTLAPDTDDVYRNAARSQHKS